MGKKCENCGKKLENGRLTHCSDKCIFESVKKCKNCGRELEDQRLTHCSDKCIYESVKKSKKFVPKKSGKA